MNTLIIPKKLAEKGELILVPRAEYEEALRGKKRLLWEEKDTDDAIRTFEKERTAGKLKKTADFSAILGVRQRRSRA